MTDDFGIPFDRVTYRSGQRLTARDLRDDLQSDARRRRLHVRYLHHTWGIALGLEVRLGKNGTRVQVGPGYAIDGFGRGLLLAETLQQPVPEVVGPEAFVLTLRYQDDAAFRERGELEQLCLGGLDPLLERPLFAWRRPDALRFGPEVPLVQVLVAAGAAVRRDDQVRRYARPLARPHIVGGSTEPGHTAWRGWPAGLEVEVVTSEAGFARAPYYFASLRGDFSAGDVAGAPPLMSPDVWPVGSEPSFPAGALGFVAAAERKRFTYRLILAADLLFARPVPPEEANVRGWRVEWFGIEPQPGCEPDVDPNRVFTLAGHSLSATAGFLAGGGSS